MKKTKLKKIAGSIAVCGLCIATAVFGTLAGTTGNIASVRGMQAYANGFVTVDSEGLGDDYKMGITRIDEDFFSPYNNNNKVGYENSPAETLIPGSSRSGSITFKNNSKTQGANIGLLFWAESTPEKRDIKNAKGKVIRTEKPYELYKQNNSAATYSAAKLKKASDLLVSKYLELEIKDQDGKTVYRGKVDGENGDEKTAEELDPDFDEPGAKYNMSSSAINIGLLHPGESKTYTFTLKIPAKSIESAARPGSAEEAAGLNHGYENTVAMIDWHFGPVIIAAPTPPSPGTGESPNMYLIASVACGVSAMVIFYFTFFGIRRRKKEEE